MHPGRDDGGACCISGRTERLPDVGGGSGGTSGILIFAGTTEGRLLAEYASAHGIGCFVSVATEYGKDLLGDLEHVTVLAGRMDEKQIKAFIEENRIRLVIGRDPSFRAGCDGKYQGGM